MAVPQFAVIEVKLFVVVFGRLFDTGYLLALPFGLVDFLLKRIRHLRVLVEVIVQQPADHVVDIPADGRAAGLHVLRTQFGLCLGLEHGLLDAYAHGRANGLADIGGIILLFVEIAHGLDHRLAQGLLVRAPVYGVLPVHKGEILLPAAPAHMRQRQFKLLFLQMDDGIHQGFVQGIGKQVVQTVLRRVFLPVENNGQPPVQVNVVPKHLFQKLGIEMEILKNLGIRHKLDKRAVGCIRFRQRIFFLQLPLFELHPLLLAVTYGNHLEILGKRVHGLHTHPVHADGFLESVRIVLAAGVHFRHTINHLIQRNAATVIPHTDLLVMDLDFNGFAHSHQKFINGIVNHFFQKDIDTVIGRVSVTELSDIHARTPLNMFVPV